MAELLFVDVIRRHLETLPGEKAGWLAGLRNPLVARALALLHKAPAQSWTLDVLAAQAGTSRSVLAERFVQFIGQPPMQYLRQLRMQLASRLLVEDGAKVVSVAAAVGFEFGSCVQSRFQEVRWPFSGRMAPTTGRVRDGGAVLDRRHRALADAAMAHTLLVPSGVTNAKFLPFGDVGMQSASIRAWCDRQSGTPGRRSRRPLLAEAHERWSSQGLALVLVVVARGSVAVLKTPSTGAGYAKLLQPVGQLDRNRYDPAG